MEIRAVPRLLNREAHTHYSSSRGLRAKHRSLYQSYPQVWAELTQENQSLGTTLILRQLVSQCTSDMHCKITLWVKGLNFCVKNNFAWIFAENQPNYEMNDSKERTSKAKSMIPSLDCLNNKGKKTCNKNKGLRFIWVGLSKWHQAMVIRLHLTQCLMSLVKFIKASR